jgi:predicted acylesterase/phospholipase RssA
MSTSNPAASPAPAPNSPRPLGELALSLSGGGYRAAGFHLGALRLLHRVGLLGDVVGLSTVSGGTLIGAAYVSSVMDGEPFDRFSARFAAYMRETNVIGEALDTLTSADAGPGVWPSLIRSAADVYARPNFLGGRLFGELLDRELPWREVIFNSTEFRTGVDFRFRRSDNRHARIGNGNFRVPREVAGNLRLADIAAASSCFPGGFEPIVFPDQFHWPASFPLEKARAALGERFAGGLSLMDGGVYDNQGIESLELAFDRGDATTLVISDVSARARNMYNVPPYPSKRGWLTLRGVGWFAWILFFLAALSAVFLLVTGFDEWRDGERGLVNVFLYTVPFVFAAAVAGALVWLRSVLKDVQARLRRDVHIANVFRDLGKLTVREMIELVELRITSLVALTSSIFMKRIRGLVYQAVYKDRKFEGRRMANLIYSLDQDYPRLFAKHPWLKPGDDLRKLALWAEAYPTSLWLTAPEDGDRLAKAGEATLCFILLKFVVEHRDEHRASDPALADLFTRLRQEWDVLNGAAAARAGAVAASPAPAAG